MGGRRITAEIVDPGRFSALLDEWASLLARAALANLSMHPAVAEAARAAGAEVLVVLAWLEATSDQGRQLVGVWVLGVGDLFRHFRSPVLLTPIHRTLMFGSPMLDRDCLVEALAAMFTALAANRALPPVLRVHEFAGGGPLQEGLRAVLAERGGHVKVLKRLVRPKLAAGGEAPAYLKQALSRKRRAELRRCRRRLDEAGIAVEFTIYRAPGEVVAAFEEFLALEAAGWKGRGGTAMIQRDPAYVAFVRGMIEGLAPHGMVNVATLRFDGRPAAMEMMLRCGGVIHTWKTSYDETLRAYGPGFLLMEDLTHAFLADPSLEFVDLSNDVELEPRGLAAYWAERHEVVDLLIEVRPTVAFQAAGIADELRRAYRAARRSRRRHRRVGRGCDTSSPG